MMIQVTRNKDRGWDVQVISVGEQIAFTGISLPGIVLLKRLRHLGESFANGLIVNASAVEDVFDAIDAANLETVTPG